MGWEILLLMLDVFKLLILARVVLSWIVSPTSTNYLVEGVRQVTEAVLRPIRNVLPAAGGLDLSPIVAFVGIAVIQHFIRVAISSGF